MAVAAVAPHFSASQAGPPKLFPPYRSFRPLYRMGGTQYPHGTIGATGTRLFPQVPQAYRIPMPPFQSSRPES
jgi:hypothetical protein